MVVIPINVNGEKKTLYMDTQLHRQLTKNVQRSVQKKDMDYLTVIDGLEGAGKSVLGMQVAKILDPNFTVDNIAFTPIQFVKKVISAKKFSCIVFDEAFTGLSSKSSMSNANKLIVETLMESRQRNLFLIIIMPTFFYLERYVVLHRAKSLFHIIFEKDGRRGRWLLYNQDRMKKLYIYGKKYMTYRQTKPIIHGTFHDTYTVDEKQYRDIKHDSLIRKIDSKTDLNKYQEYLYALFYHLNKNKVYTQNQIVDIIKQEGLHTIKKRIVEYGIEKHKKYLYQNNIQIDKDVISDDSLPTLR